MLFECDQKLGKKNSKYFFILFFKDFIFKRGRREGEREAEKHHVWLPLMRPILGTWLATQACALTGN